MLPFTRDQFLSVFAGYNAAIWPAQIVAVFLGATAVVLVFRESRRADLAVAAILAAMWAWTEVGYHWLAFTAVAPVAWAFGALFLLEGVGLAVAGLGGRLAFGFRRGLSASVGTLFVAYALLYPLIGMALGEA